ncbi:MAG TPA: hypothetical protein VGR11_17490 [Solirubrobacteraceae bacterium]|nr:hypothetical protein [Solirubrobacteraceae bacterium]
MADEKIPHEDNQTPDVSDDDVKRMDKDTEQNPNPGAGANEGAGADNPVGGGNVEERADPKTEGGTTQVKAP